MEFSPYLAHLVAEERIADAIRDAEQWRLIKSGKKHDSSSGWLRQLGLSLRQLVSVHPDGRAGEPRPGPRQTVSDPTI